MALEMRFTKYHGLGNDYLVINPVDVPQQPTPDQVRLICHRNYGPGSDGILYGPLTTDSGHLGLTILNPDGSEAEKSGNGLRIFSRYLFDIGKFKHQPFSLQTRGGLVRCCVRPDGFVEVDMGRVSFDAKQIPVRGHDGEVLNKTIILGGVNYTFCAATIGNPHCVLLMEEVSEELAKRLGPQIECDARFPNRTNVQFLKVLGRNDIKIEIWERGAGYTLASGSSSSAAAAVAHRLGYCDGDITVHMPGGSLQIQLTHDFQVKMTGPVVKVCDGTIASEAFSTEIRA